MARGSCCCSPRAPSRQRSLKLAWGHFQRNQTVDAQAVLAGVRKAGGQERPLAILLDADLQLRAGRVEQGRKRLQEFVDGGGTDYDAFMALASFAAREGEKERMAELLERARKAWPLDTHGENPYTLLIAYYRGTGKQDEALRVMEEQAAIDSKNIELRLQLSREYVSRNRKQDALRVLDEALRVTLFDRRVHEARLPLLREFAMKKKAVDAARCVVALRTEQDDEIAMANMLLDLAEVLFEDGRGEEARAVLEDAAKSVDAEQLPRLDEVRKKIQGAGQ